MHPKLTNIFINDSAELRQLLLTSMENIFSTFQILDLEAPLPGEPILLLNQENSLVIISFDLLNTGNALLNGLQAQEKLLGEITLFARLYPALKPLSDLRARTKLLLFTPADTKDDLDLDLISDKISHYTYRGIGVNGETALMVESVVPISVAPKEVRQADATNEHDQSQMQVIKIPHSSSEASELSTSELTTSELSTDEVIFFQQL